MIDASGSNALISAAPASRVEVPHRGLPPTPVALKTLEQGQVLVQVGWALAAPLSQALVQVRAEVVRFLARAHAQLGMLAQVVGHRRRAAFRRSDEEEIGTGAATHAPILPRPRGLADALGAAEPVRGSGRDRVIGHVHAGRAATVAPMRGEREPKSGSTVIVGTAAACESTPAEAHGR